VLVVVDPNVLLSAALSPTGTPAALIRRWLDGEFEVLVSEKLLAELSRALAYPKIARRIPVEDARLLVGLLDEEAESAPDAPCPAGIRVADPDDEYLIGLASSRGAALVSGDRHLTALTGQFPVFSPADFLARLGQ
jgi:putative PIN family toxin of toxin-antitoxin system